MQKKIRDNKHSKQLKEMVFQVKLQAISFQVILKRSLLRIKKIRIKQPLKKIHLMILQLLRRSKSNGTLNLAHML